MENIQKIESMTLEQYQNMLLESSHKDFYDFMDNLCTEVQYKLKKVKNDFFKGISKEEQEELILDLVQEAFLSQPEDFFTGDMQTLSIDSLVDTILKLGNTGDKDFYQYVRGLNSVRRNEGEEEDDEYRYSSRKNIGQVLHEMDEETNSAYYWQQEMQSQTESEEQEELSDEHSFSQQNLRKRILDLLMPSEEECKELNLSEKQAEALFEQRKDRFEKLVAYSKAATEYLQNYILALEEKRQNRFKAVYLYARYRQDVAVATHPSRRKTNAKDEEMHAINSWLVSASQKQIQLLNHYWAMDFWGSIVKPLFPHELDYNGFEGLNQLFEKYRTSFSKNVGRDWKGEKDINGEMQDLLDSLKEQKDFGSGIEAQDRAELIKQWEYELDIKPFFTAGTKLKRPEKTEELYERDNVFGNSEEVTCCKEYKDVISLFTRQEVLHKEDFLPDETKFQAYRKHRKDCTDCLQYESKMRQKWIWRFSRMHQKMQQAIHYFYKAHQPETKNQPLDDTSASIRYYKEVFRDRPSDLYKAYLDILYVRDGKKEGFEQTAQSIKKQTTRQTKLGYELEARCMCGAVNRYQLNALRFPWVVVGCKPEQELPRPHIGLCSDDELFLSTNMYCFKYNLQLEDWTLEVGSGEENQNPDKLNALSERIYYVTIPDLFDKLTNIKTAGGDPVACEKNLKNSWRQLKAGEQIPLSQIALIRVIKGSGFMFNGKKSEGVYHPIFGLLENTAWLMEINANRSDSSIIASMVGGTVPENIR